MILSSADILKILGGNEIIRSMASLTIVDGKPSLTGKEGIHIYIDRFPALEEFEATWTLYIEADEDADLVITELKRILPSAKVGNGLMTTVTTTDFRSESTQRAPEAPKPQKAQVDLTQYEERFQELVEDVQDQMLLINSGRPGKDGKDGLPGAPGRDGKDIDATDTELFELKDVDQSILPMEKGQVLTWDGSKWTNLYIPDKHKVAGGGGGSSDVQNLDDLGDVDAPSPNNGDMISYNSTSGNWEAVAAPPADISGNSIDDLADVDTTTSAPGVGQTLKWDGTNWVPADDTGAVSSVNGEVGVVVLDASDVGAATTAQGALADSAVQPGDNISTLTNDAGYITDAGVTQIVAGTNVTIDPVGGTGAVTINATGGGTGDADGGDFGPLPDPDGGDFEAGTTTSTLAYPVDGGDFEADTTEAFGDSSFDGGEVT